MVAPSPPPGEERSLGLALVNTELAHRGEPVDVLGDRVAAGAWLDGRGLGGPESTAITAAASTRYGAPRIDSRVLRAGDRGVPRGNA